MPENKTEIDTTFYETLPPQMIDLRHLPPMQSDSAEIERSDVGFDEVNDPHYPIDTIEHDTDEGYARWQALKKKKKDEVAGYLIIRNKHWEQTQTWRFFPDDQKETLEVFTGSTETHSKEYTVSIEAQLGLKKGIFNGSLKSKFTFTKKDTKTFSKSTKHTIEKKYEGNCYYLYWQIIESFDLYRRPKANPDEYEYVNSFSGYTDTYMVNKYNQKDLAKGAKAMPPLTAAAKVLKKGESRTVGTRLIGKTKFCFKNLSEQEKGEVALTPGIGGLWRPPWVISVNPGYTKSIWHGYMADFVKITNSGAHDMEVWTG